MNSKFFFMLEPGFQSEMWLPSHFSEVAAANGGHSSEATLKTDLGMWEIPLWSSNGKFYFNGDGVKNGNDGWDAFVQEHKLFVGDTLTFKHYGKMVFKVEVFDFSKKVKDYSDNGASSSLLQAVPKITFEKAITVTMKEKKMAFPKSIWKDEEWFYNKEWVIARVGERGEQMRIKLHLNRAPKHSYHDCLHMSSGWPEFCKRNGIDVGDRCIFEITDRGSNHVLMQITIVECRM